MVYSKFNLISIFLTYNRPLNLSTREFCYMNKHHIKRGKVAIARNGIQKFLLRIACGELIIQIQTSWDDYKRQKETWCNSILISVCFDKDLVLTLIVYLISKPAHPLSDDRRQRKLLLFHVISITHNFHRRKHNCSYRLIFESTTFVNDES